ncbi:uncharacterized protein TNCV_1606571 [Trichonephila clavipes]|nr:uncharacterized protein TNCV_1606571 [Trichonephila clavipes]
MQLLPELDTLDPLKSTDAFDQLMSFVFGPQELQLLHTVPSIFDGNLFSFLHEFERAPMDLTMPRLNSCVKKSIGFKAIQPMDLSVNGESRDIALKRLNAPWTRLIRDPQYLKLYRDFIHDYDQLGHMKEVVAEHDNSEVAYYMPHHGVLRPEKSTTKLRVVFNATNPTSNGLSLNSIQYNGVLAQNDLFTIMIKFREHPYAFTADVKMMYRMKLIHESQQPLLRILWKESPEDPVKTFEMKTVTYGTVSAPFLATRTLLQLSRDEEKNFPLAAPVLRENFYMDDVLCGAASLMEAKALKNQLSGILKKVEWNCTSGLPSERAKEWHRFLEDFNSVRSICIGRCIVHPQATRVELHGFADASEKCYGPVIYCRSQSPNGATTVKLVTSKSRVAPVKSVTMPRLELCAAVLLAKLMKRVETALQMKTPPCTCGVTRLLS